MNNKKGQEELDREAFEKWWGWYTSINEHAPFNQEAWGAGLKHARSEQAEMRKDMKWLCKSFIEEAGYEPREIEEIKKKWGIE